MEEEKNIQNHRLHRKQTEEFKCEVLRSFTQKSTITTRKKQAVEATAKIQMIHKRNELNYQNKFVSTHQIAIALTITIIRGNFTVHLK